MASKLFSALKNTVTAATALGSPATLTGWYVYNRDSTASYVQLFDPPLDSSLVLGTTAPTRIIAVPATAAANLSGVSHLFKNGIWFAVTTTPTGSTAPSSGCDGQIDFL